MALDESRYRRRVLGVGGLLAFLLFVVGAPIFNNRIENDLERRVPVALARAGYDGITAKFSGQEGRLSCAAPLADPEGALAAARRVRGVDAVELDRGCRVNTLGGDVTVTGSATTTLAPSTTASSTMVLDQGSLPEEREPATSVTAVEATWAGGSLTAAGPVADEAARATLVFAGTAAVGPDRFDDQLTVAPSGLDAEQAGQLAALIAALDAELVSGEAGYDGSGLYLTGAFANAADQSRAEAAAELAGATADLEPRPNATADQAAALETELNALVAARPITFGQGSAVLDESAVAIIDELAARLVELGGIAIVVEGHTDSDGSATTNQTLSEQRAGAVLQALVERGVTPDTISSEGFGSQRPVVGASGIEDKTASRRVEFRITTA